MDATIEFPEESFSLINEQGTYLDFAKPTVDKNRFGKTSYLWMNQYLTYLGLISEWLCGEKPNENLNLKNLLPTIKHGNGEIIVSGCFATSGMGNLVFLENNMEQYKYIWISWMKT